MLKGYKLLTNHSILGQLRGWLLGINIKLITELLYQIVLFPPSFFQSLYNGSTWYQARYLHNKSLYGLAFFNTNIDTIINTSLKSIYQNNTAANLSQTIQFIKKQTAHVSSQCFLQEDNFCQSEACLWTLKISKLVRQGN